MVVVLSLMSLRADAEEASLAWDASTDEDVEGYRIYYGTQSGRYGKSVDVGDVTQYELAGLKPGVTYYIAVAAYNSEGMESPKSNELRFNSDTTVPTHPDALSGRGVSAAEAALRWESAHDPESGIEHYRIYRDGAEVGQAESLSFKEGGLNEGTEYRYEVTAVNGAGLEGPRAGPVKVATRPDRTPPGIIAVRVLGERRVSVTFNEAVTRSSAEEVGNYEFDGGVSVKRASLREDRKTVELGVERLREGTPYALKVGGVRDTSARGNPANGCVTLELTPHLVARWPLVEGDGRTVMNVTGQGHEGTLRGPEWIREGPVRGLAFNRDDDFVDLGALDVAGAELTLAVWFRAADFNGNAPRLISKAAGAANEEHYWMLGLSTGSPEPRLRFRLKSGGETTELVSKEGLVEAGRWYHLAATYDGSAMRIYLNGRQIATRPKTGALAGNPEVPVAIGNQPEGAGIRPFRGALTDVRVYDRALGRGDLLEIMEEVSDFPSNGNPTLEIKRLWAGLIRVIVRSQCSQVVVVESSDDLVSWEVAGRETVSAGKSGGFVYDRFENPVRFFRVKPSPNSARRLDAPAEPTEE